jgi:hypothetical protein
MCRWTEGRMDGQTKGQTNRGSDEQADGQTHNNDRIRIYKQNKTIGLKVLILPVINLLQFCGRHIVSAVEYVHLAERLFFRQNFFDDDVILHHVPLHPTFLSFVERRHLLCGLSQLDHGGCIGVRQGVAMDSLKFLPGPPCPTLLRRPLAGRADCGHFLPF